MKTQRLTIINYKPDDYKSLWKIIEKYNATEFSKYDMPWPNDIEKIKEVTQFFAGNDDFLAVWLDETSKLIGHITFNKIDNKESVEFGIGFIFNYSYHGRGYATEACNAVLSYAFESLNADKVTSGTAGNNLLACRLLERIGMSVTGQLTPISDETDEKWHVAKLFAITKGQWFK